MFSPIRPVGPGGLDDLLGCQGGVGTCLGGGRLLPSVREWRVVWGLWFGVDEARWGLLLPRPPPVFAKGLPTTCWFWAGDWLEIATDESC
jgi:hypothetical protein